MVESAGRCWAKPGVLWYSQLMVCSVRLYSTGEVLTDADEQTAGVTVLLFKCRGSRYKFNPQGVAACSPCRRLAEQHRPQHDA